MQIAPFGRLSRRRAWAFIHIPKTSGWAVNEAIVEALKPSSFIIAIDRCLFGDFDAFETISPEVRTVVRLHASEFPQNAGVVSGHIALSTIRTAYPSAKVFSRALETLDFFGAVEDLQLDNRLSTFLGAS